MISCGEPSGDLYAGALAAALRRQQPNLDIFGFGGRRLAAAGGRLLGSYEGLAVTGLSEVLRTLPRTWRMYRHLVTEAERRFITQRTHPAMATIEVAIDAQALRLGAPGRAPLEVAVDHGGLSYPVTVWNSECLGVDAGDAAASWVSAVLGERLRLVRQDPARPRLASTQYAGPGERPVSFADAYPILMISRASLEELILRQACGMGVRSFSRE